MTFYEVKNKKSYEPQTKNCIKTKGLTLKLTKNKRVLNIQFIPKKNRQVIQFEFQFQRITKNRLTEVHVLPKKLNISDLSTYESL